jgi:ligand-binding sensor domain-containing protein
LVERAFADDSIWSLAVAPDGTLWIGTEGGGLVRFRSGTFRRFANADGLSNLFIRAIYAKPDGSLWVGTDQGLFEAQNAGNDSDHFHRVDATSSIPAMNVYTIHGARNGTLYVGGSGLLELDSHGAHVFRQRAGDSEDGVVGAVQVSRNGKLWIGTQAALRAFGPQTQYTPTSDFNPFDKAHRVSIPYASKLHSDTNQQRHLHVSVLTESRDGSLWIGTYGDGLLRWKDGSFRWFRTPEFLPDNHISSIFEDAQRDIWIGTPSGLVRLKDTASTSVRLPDGAPVDNINSIANDSTGNVILASLEGKLLQSSGAVLSPASVTGLPADLTIRTTFRDRTGVLWIGTAGQGLYSVADGVATHYSSPDFIRAFAQSPNGVLWVGTDGPLWSNSTGRFLTLAGSNKTSYRALAFDKRGVLWAGSDSGLECIANGKLLNDTSLAPLEMTKIWSLLADRDGNVWIGSRGSGLYLWRHGQLKHYTSAAGFPAESIFLSWKIPTTKSGSAALKESGPSTGRP